MKCVSIQWPKAKTSGFLKGRQTTSTKHVARMIEYLKIKQTKEVHVDMFLDFWLLFEAFLPSKLHKT